MLFQRNIEGQDEKTFPIFHVTIENSKETGEMEFNSLDPTLEYHQTLQIVVDSVVLPQNLLRQENMLPQELLKK